MTAESPFQIVKSGDIPSVPERNKYPFNNMAVGDAFFVPNRNIRQMSSACAANVHVKFGDWRFTCWTEKNEDGTHKGVWVKRIV